MTRIAATKAVPTNESIGQGAFSSATWGAKTVMTRAPKLTIPKEVAWNKVGKTSVMQI